MILDATDSTGKKFRATIGDIGTNLLKAMADFEMTDEHLKKLIDGLGVSADAKSALYKMSKTTIRVGQQIIKIGRKILDCVANLFNEFPQAGFGMIFGAIVSYLIGSIPVIGFVFGPFMGPLLIAFGLLGGAYQDIRDKNLARRIALVNRQFSGFES